MPENPATPEPAPDTPLTLTDQQLLEFLVSLELQRRAQQRGVSFLTRPHPDCPACGARVDTIRTVASGGVHLLGLPPRLILQPCGHDFVTTDKTVDRLLASVDIIATERENQTPEDRRALRVEAEAAAAAAGVVDGPATLREELATDLRERVNRIDQLLHRHGIARVINSVCGNNRPDVYINVQGRRWTPKCLAVRAGHRHFLRSFPTWSAGLYLADVEAIRTAADGSRRWRLHYRPTHTA